MEKRGPWFNRPSGLLALKIWQEINDSTETKLHDSVFMEENDNPSVEECWLMSAEEMADGLRSDNHLYYHTLCLEECHTRGACCSIADQYVRAAKKCIGGQS